MEGHEKGCGCGTCYGAIKQILFAVKLTSKKLFTWFIFSEQLGATHNGSLLPLSWLREVPNLLIDKNLIWCMLWNSKTKFKINIIDVWPAPITLHFLQNVIIILHPF